MAIERMEHVGIVVDDLAAAIGFFTGLGLELLGETPVEGDWVDRIIGLTGVHADIALMQTLDGHGQIELTEFHTPPSDEPRRELAANAPGLRHLSFGVSELENMVAALRERGTELVGEIVRYKDSYLLCYVRGPGGIIIELAEKLG